MKQHIVVHARKTNKVRGERGGGWAISDRVVWQSLFKENLKWSKVGGEEGIIQITWNQVIKI